MNQLKHFRLLLIAGLIILFNTAKAGNIPIDSLTTAITKIMSKPVKTGNHTTKYQVDTAHINHYLWLAKEYQTENNDSLNFYVQKAIRGAIKLADLPLISRSLQMYGRYFMMKEEYPNATACFLLSLKIEENGKNRKRIADLSDELAGIYYYEEIFDKSLSYNNTALALYIEDHDTVNIAKSYTHLGILYSSREYCEQRTSDEKKVDFNTAISYLQKSLSLCVALRKKPQIINNFVNLASVYNKLNQPQKALPYLIQALNYYRSTNDLFRLSGTLHTTGMTYCKAKQYSQSEKCYLESLKIAQDNNFTEGIQYLYESMAQTYDEMKDYKNARDFYVKYMTIRDSLNTAEKSKEIFALETKFQTEKKEKEIAKLTAEKREKNLLLFALTSLMLVASVLGYFVLKNIRNKKLIAEQTLEIKERHIQELEKERLLIATKSVLKGEETERSRMARDLHDGLGGLLSGVKINLSAMKGNSILTSENAETFDNAIRLLDTSISELRRVAHNLMPETLNRYGLKIALTDFITEISSDQTPALTFHFFGDDVRYTNHLELTMYRIAQELVNNALKHSGATSINLQLIGESDRVCVQVVDNGKGFDTSIKRGDGKGLMSIHDRVAANNGRFEIESSPGQGTEATIEFLLS